MSNDTQVLTLTEFLLARIAEDEAAAKLGVAARTWEMEDDEVVTIGVTVCALNLGGAGEHIARHDPARVLRECEAKRQIIAFHEQWPVLAETPPTMETVPSDDPQSVVMRASQQIQWMTQQEYRARFGDEPPTTPMLRALAAVYADHPDYQESQESWSDASGRVDP